MYKVCAMWSTVQSAPLAKMSILLQDHHHHLLLLTLEDQWISVFILIVGFPAPSAETTSINNNIYILYPAIREYVTAEIREG